jgi:4-carboxymuconolactone decarboxylase
MADPVFERGLEIRRSMFGAEATDAQVNATDDFTDDLQDLVTRYCFGSVWAREELPLNLRSMLTVAMVLASGRDAELKLHIRGAIANGVTRTDIRELLLQSVMYCGFPAAVGGFRAARQVFDEIDRGESAPDPTR